MKRPFAGVGVSLVVHAGVLALVLVVAAREDALPALMIDLREGLVPIRALVRDVLPGRAATGSPRSPRKSGAPTPGPAAPAAAPEASEPSPPGVMPVLLASPAPAEAPRSEAPSAVAGAASADRTGVGADPARGGGAVSASGAAFGSTQGGPGAPGGGIGAEYGPYLRALRQRIQQSVRYPASARRRGVSGTVSVELLVLADGAIGEVTLLGSSGHDALDEAALETLRSLPRTPLPRDLPARPLRVRVPVVFEMRTP